ncbi:hypothetical protein L207DRAFT_335186 [Hyaloscypha variabilis F]|uniref:Uncharacterized protein n=1 Tax=Hyaloscypha variabilis (strain UAMH 11265 / GT02V1 / F) TaxID=1149755 RepID=A0A2J6RNV6_HYAVF|nr:hypothetical protein L207DRAFT_335186 [Hyaloscypha variabilis F]
MSMSITNTLRFPHLRPPFHPNSSPLSRTFSTNSNPRLYSTNPNPKQQQNQNPSMGGASFKDLGANRTVKVVVYVSLGVIATLESVTWGKLLWRRFGPRPGEGEE